MALATHTYKFFRWFSSRQMIRLFLFQDGNSVGKDASDTKMVTQKHDWLLPRCSFTLDATPLSHRMFLLHAVLPSAEAQNGGGAEGERADVGEIPFGESLERSRVHKWTRQLALRRLPFRSSFSSKFSTSRLARFGDRAEFIERFSTFFFLSFFLSINVRKLWRFSFNLVL